MARNRRSRRRGTLYRQVHTGTKNLESSGAQIHVGTIEPMDPALRGCYLENVNIAVIPNTLPAWDTDYDPGGSDPRFISQSPSFTYYLSYQGPDDGDWTDDGVIAASSTSQGGGNLTLTAKRSIWTDQTGSTVAQQLGPIHIWAEATKTTLNTDVFARHTISVWGRMYKVDYS